jgi:two-component system response regulator RegX3
VEVLIVEGDPKTAEDLARHFRKHGIRAHTTGTGQDALERFSAVDAVLLNPKLPDTDGLEACRAIRSISNIPILMVSEEDDELECILALKLGADDYISRPYRGRELIARVQAVVRRAGGLNCPRPEIAQKAAGEILRSGSLHIDLRDHQVWVNDTEVYLTCKEFDLLALLATEPGRVFTREAIMMKVWGHDGAGDTRTLRVHVSLLRKKLMRPELIETVRGVGFRLGRA